MATIIDPPAALRSAQIGLRAVDTLAETRSVYSGAESRLDFGGEWWELTLSLPPLGWDDSADVVAWCDRLRDADAVAKIGLGAIAPRRGTSTADTLTVGANTAAGGRSLLVSGVGADKTLGAGSFVSTSAGRLHRLRTTVTAGGAGFATLDLFPRLRDALTSGESLRSGGATPAVGLWRMQGRPGHDWSFAQYGRLTAPRTLTFVEAL